MKSGDSSEGEFIKEAAGPPGLFAVFEDDGETGCLYLYEPGSREVFHHLHTYDRNPDLTVHEQDVRIVWSEDLSKVGVQIWGVMRGIINLATGEDCRVRVEKRDTPGIVDSGWLSGF
jgi:hypothetical protein